MNHNQMQSCLDRLGVPLTVHWVPDKAKPVHGEIRGSALFVYDLDEEEAWFTLQHEIAEYKLQSVTRPYRLLVNSLLEAIEKSLYAQKEEFVNSLPKMSAIIEEVQEKQRVTRRVGLKYRNLRKRA
jgi:hypothetical protein